MELIPIELSQLVKDKKIKQIYCLVDKYQSKDRIKQLDKNSFEFDGGCFIIELDNGSFLNFNNSEWGFAQYYSDKETLEKELK